MITENDKKCECGSNGFTVDNQKLSALFDYKFFGSNYLYSDHRAPVEGIRIKLLELIKEVFSSSCSREVETRVNFIEDVFGDLKDNYSLDDYHFPTYKIKKFLERVEQGKIKAIHPRDRHYLGVVLGNNEMKEKKEAYDSILESERLSLKMNALLKDL